MALIRHVLHSVRSDSSSQTVSEMEMENKIFVNRAFPLGSIPSISRSSMLQTLRQFVADHYVG